MHARLFLTACASAALLSVGACNGNDANTTDQTKAAPNTAAQGTSGSEDRTPQPIALTGCLQKGDHSDYILTQINEPNAGAVTTPGDKVEREQINAAEHAYRLNAKDTNDDDWAKLVGRQVHVSGTVAKRSDVAQQVGTSGSSAKTDTNQDRVKIHESDLAQVDVSQIQQVAASCGGHTAKRSGKSAPKARR